jgi:hypothetical protein
LIFHFETSSKKLEASLISTHWRISVRKVLEIDDKKGLEDSPKPLIVLVAGRGFEPLTFGL